MSHILVFGDSITCGAWDEEGGWVARLQKEMNRRAISSGLESVFLVSSLGVDGDTSEGLLERLETETKRRVSKYGTIIILAIGSNDSEFNSDLGKTHVPEERFKKNIENIFEKARIFSNNIIFVGLLPVDESKVDPIPWLPEMSYKNKYIKGYDEFIRSFCKNNKIDFVELYEKFEKMDYKKLLEDGVHPNSAGHKKIYEIVSGYLKKRNII